MTPILSMNLANTCTENNRTWAVALFVRTFYQEIVVLDWPSALLDKLGPVACRR